MNLRHTDDAGSRRDTTEAMEPWQMDACRRAIIHSAKKMFAARGISRVQHVEFWPDAVQYGFEVVLDQWEKVRSLDERSLVNYACRAFERQFHRWWSNQIGIHHMNISPFRESIEDARWSGGLEPAAVDVASRMSALMEMHRGPTRDLRAIENYFIDRWCGQPVSPNVKNRVTKLLRDHYPDFYFSRCEHYRLLDALEDLRWYWGRLGVSAVAEIRQVVTCRGNLKEAAKKLGVLHNTLKNRVDTYIFRMIQSRESHLSSVVMSEIATGDRRSLRAIG